MSKQIDERVVSMQFDNKHFESNVQTSLSTLDKLKEKLNLSGASKGLENINTAAGKIDMGSLGNAVETVRARFSALDIMGVTALANITNATVNAGKQLVKSLTIDPVKTGFNEYELKMDSVRTIMASTGETVETVNDYLEKLNEYSDQTIYSFKDMTQNIGKFTNAGVKLEDAVLAIKGISNEAAVSGANANEASRAMYNFAQALSAGYVKLIDWKSIELANMATVEFKNELIKTAVELGTVVKVGEEYKSTTTDANGRTSELFTQTKAFNESLSAQWMTTDVLVKTLGRYADANTEIGKKAFDAATKVTKFTQMLDVLKETAQSGWAKTWEIIFGDIEKAKALFTPLTNFFSKILDTISDARNELLESALGKGFKGLLDGFNSVIKPAEEAIAVVQDLGDIVNKVIIGEFGNGIPRFDALTEAGYNYYRVQNKVNETLGNSYRYTEEQIKSQDELLGLTSKSVDATVEFNEVTKNNLLLLTKLSDEQLRNKGYTEEQIDAIRELSRQAEKLGLSTTFFVKNLDQINGRWLLINSFKNIGEMLVVSFHAIAKAWREIFDPITSDQLFNIIAGFHKFTTTLKMNTETANKVTRAFKGLFAIVDVITTLFSGGFKIAFKILKQVLEYFNIGVLDAAACVGDALVQFRDWFDSIFNVGKIVEKVVPWIKTAIDVISELVAKVKESEAFKKFTKYLRDSRRAIVDWFSGIDISKDSIQKWFAQFKESKAYEIGSNIISGLINGLKNGLGKVGETMVSVAKFLIDKIKNFLGIHSPSTVFMAIGGFIIAGLVAGLLGNIPAVGDAMKEVAGKCTAFISKIDFGAIFAGAISVGFLVVLNKIANAFSVFEGLGDMFERFGRAALNFSRGFKKIGAAAQYKALASVFTSVAIAIGVLAASVWLLSTIDTAKMWNAVGGIGLLIIIVGALAVVLMKFAEKVDLKNLGGFVKVSAMLLSLGASLMLVAFALKVLSGIESPDKVIAFMTGIMVLFAAFIKSVNWLEKDIDKVGGTLIKMAVAIGLLTIVAKMIAKMSWGDMGKAAVGLLGLVGILALLMLTTKLAGKNIDKVGSTLLSMAGAIAILTLVAKTIAGMSWGDMGKAAVGILGLTGVIYLLMLIVKKYTKRDLTKLGSTLLAIAGAIAILTLVAKTIAGMSWGDMGKAAVGILGLTGIMYLLMLIVKKYTKRDLTKLGTTLIAMGAAIGIMAVSVALLGLLKPKTLAKGLVAVGMLAALLSLMVYATKGASECKDNIMAMAVTIAVMTAALVILSFIKPKKLFSAALALSSVMAVFALMIKSTSSMKSGFKSVIGVLATLTIIVGLLAGVIYLLSKQPVGSVLSSAAALSMLLLSMTGALFILNNVGRTSKNAFLGVVALLAMAVPMLAFVGVLALMQNVQNAAKNATILTMLMTAMTLLLVPLLLAGALFYPALLGVVSLLAMAVPMVAFVGILALMQGIKNAEANVNLLIKLMTTMAGVLIVLAPISPLAILAATALTALATVVTTMGVVVVAIGWLMEKFPVLEQFLDKGLVIFEKLAEGMGRIFGALISGFLDTVTSGLPEIGSRLGEFMTNLEPFIEGAKKIDGAVLAGVGFLAAAIIAISTADLIAGIASFLQGGSSFADLGTELSMFMVNATPFIMGAKMISSEMSSAVKALAETILILTASSVIEGLTSWLTGGNSLAEFGAQLPQLGSDIAAFAESVGTFGPEQVTTVTCAANAIKALAEAADKLPNEGGWLGKIVGENNIGTFGKMLPQLGTDISGFAANLNGFTSDKVDTVKCASEAIKAIADAAEKLPNQGGWLGKVVGENNINTFGGYLPDLGKNINGFANELGTFDDSKVKTISSAANAIKAMGDVAKNLPNQGGWWAKIVGDNSIETFGGSLPGLGTHLKGFANNLGTFGDAQVTSVNAAIRVLNSISNLASNGLKSIKDNIGGVGSNLVGFAGNIKTYCTNLPDTATLNGAVSRANIILDFIKGMKGFDDEALKKFKNAIKDLATLGLTDFKISFAGEEAIEEVYNSGDKVISAVIEAMTAKTAKMTEIGNSISKSAAAAIGSDSNYTAFATAGSHLVDGFVAGINAGRFRAIAATAAMALAAKTAAEVTLGIESPSKVFSKIGMFVSEGFAIGIDKLSSRVTNSSENMANSAVSTVSDTISNIAKLVSSDIDAQPTIRPVLDLSDVESGVGTIGSLLGMGSSIGVSANVGAISSMMNARSQNGVNSDLINAIDKLRGDLGNIGNTTYSINGITYDDGSNISEAVGALVRAAKVERRI